jgi:predicted acylesterase/phospholipase RssA
MSWFALARQPQEPLAPHGETLTGDALAEWKARFRPFLKYLRRKEVVLALSGGGMAMPCHVSVLRILELLEVPISRIYGTSAGAVVGGLHAAGLSAVDIESVVLSIESPDQLFGFAARLPGLRMVTGAVVRTLTGPSLERSGIYDLSRVEHYMEEVLEKYVGGVPTFADLRTDFSCVALDIGTGGPDSSPRELAQKTVFSKHTTPDLRLSEALGASMSIPGALTPKRIGERFYLDGATIEHLPITTALEDWQRVGRPLKRKQVTIAVDLGYSGEAPPEKEVCTPADLVMYANSIQSLALTQYSLLRCHRPRKGTSVVLVKPKTFSISLCDIEKIPSALFTGYRETVSQLSGSEFLKRTEESIAKAKGLLGVGQG